MPSLRQHFKAYPRTDKQVVSSPWGCIGQNGSRCLLSTLPVIGRPEAGTVCVDPGMHNVPNPVRHEMCPWAAATNSGFFPHLVTFLHVWHESSCIEISGHERPEN